MVLQVVGKRVNLAPADPWGDLDCAGAIGVRLRAGAGALAVALRAGVALFSVRLRAGGAGVFFVRFGAGTAGDAGACAFVVRLRAGVGVIVSPPPFRRLTVSCLAPRRAGLLQRHARRLRRPGTNTVFVVP
jgi:hypothetical protein